MKLRHTIADRVAGFVRDWSLPRQFAGEDPTREAAQSTMSRQLRPRLEEADTIGTSICPYCAVGCAQLVYAKDGHVTHIEGDPRSPINQGTLCPKGAATFGWLTNPGRLTKVLYRAPHAESWEERPLGWAMDRIAYLVKRTRDESFVRNLPDGTPVNHTLAIGSLGGATLDNEENYLYPKEGDNRARARRPDGPDGPGTHLGWAWAWPANRRNMYNRASADEQGRPWSERKRLMSWDTARGEWVGPDIVDFEPKKPPDYQPDWSKSPESMEALGGDCPFIMIADGKASLFTPSGLKDAPVPAHYEPVESPVKNPLYRQQSSPVAKIWERPDNRLHVPADPRFPYALTTYRLTEHHAGGIPTRSVPVTAELQPEAFAEIFPELAESLGIRNLDWVTVSTLRGEVEVKALVTERVRPFKLDSQTVHEVGLVWHFGWEGFARGDIANILSAVVGDPNTSIHEGKAFTCNLRGGRREATR